MIGSRQGHLLAIDVGGFPNIVVIFRERVTVVSRLRLFRRCLSVGLAGGGVPVQRTGLSVDSSARANQEVIKRFEQFARRAIPLTVADAY